MSRMKTNLIQSVTKIDSGSINFLSQDRAFHHSSVLFRARFQQILLQSSTFHRPEKKYANSNIKTLFRQGTPIVKKRHSIFHHDPENTVRNFHSKTGRNNNSETMICKRRVIGAIDQGTTSTRFMLFDANDLSELSSYQLSHESYYPKPGWVEQEPMVILQNTVECMSNACDKLEIDDVEIVAIGVTNQRETTVLWDSETGEPLCRAIVWNDTRTKDLVDSICKEKANGDYSKFRDICGLPLSTYFSAVKLRWMIDHYPEVKKSVERGTCMFGTVDSWLIWNLTGGTKGGIHITDVTNASRTMLMNLQTLQWDEEMLQVFNIPSGVKLPTIKSSAEIYAPIQKDIVQEHPLLSNVVIAGCIGDQQSATIGQRCFNKGDTKNTYGTGCFLLMNCGNEIVKSTHGLLSTVQYQLGSDSKPVYALEGSVAVCGSGVTWLQQNLKIISNPSESETVARTVSDTGGVYFVPAFSGLFCPYWRQDARGTIVGITQYTNSAHIVRAMLEAVCYQTQEVLEAMCKDSGTDVANLMVDGGMTKNSLLMQLQADISRKKVRIPSYSETTVLGAAICACFGVKIFHHIKDVPAPHKDKMLIFKPHISEEETQLKMKRWRKAVSKSLDWHEE
ncbi:hypothetical protein C9374_004952 [Naegleria lovaniensis]|uniref:glycerol kinase n=1 Tax=Naegleria lovaniensis TaxID=51637 RepID=A0AA88KKW8_NAELO|nr:uncharacterized protein C9374_004952 [Naegleria lovaniensis]KAG2382985.1 hypothetical protein C9374_004952 [Naegleria lovaniensis]